MSDSKIIRQHSENSKPGYVLQLFITGATPNSTRAIANIKAICEEHLRDNYQLEIVDVYRENEMAGRNQVVALPMLIVRYPLPEKKLIGDMSRKEKVLAALGV
jgi:circadian clock protein KaiB